MAYISVGSQPSPILEFLEEWSMENLEEISPAAIADATKIFVNGCWVGIHKDPEQLMNTLRKLRRQMDIIVSEVQLQDLGVFGDEGGQYIGTALKTLNSIVCTCFFFGSFVK
ncbi:DNA-directed RNA polymerase II subunit RPB2-like, partial [Meleagris gallopavo]|uniref:DNA-directed RNA polymerase II subunit RPB2-like n=1 Tax=Meleagris gallopavo TaxID=9103 RepID=UPI000549C5DE